MLIDLERQSIFIKTNKTAGTSLEIALSRWMNPQRSVITPITPEDEQLRRSSGGLGPCGYLHFQAPAPLRPRIGFSRAPSGCTFYNHMSYRELRATLPDGALGDAWSFGFTRHPYTRALSIYTFRHRGVPGFPQLSLEAHRDLFLAFLRQGHLRSTADALTDGHGHSVSAVLRFEELEQAVHTIAGRWGLQPEQLLPLPQAKMQYGQALLPFPREALLSATACDLIRRICRWEFDHHYLSSTAPHPSP